MLLGIFAGDFHTPILRSYQFFRNVSDKPSAVQSVCRSHLSPTEYLKHTMKLTSERLGGSYPIFIGQMTASLKPGSY